MKKILFTTVFTVMFIFSLFSQNMVTSAQKFLKENLQELNLTSTDLANLRISDQYVSSTSDITHLYFQQTHEGIGVYQGILNIHLKPNGEVLTYGNRCIPNLEGKTNSATPRWTAQQAIESAAKNLGYNIIKPIQILKTPIGIEQKSLFSKGNISQEDIPATLVWQLMPDKKVRLCWDISILEPSGENWWSVRVDAQTGELLDKTNWMVHCDWEDHAFNDVSEKQESYSNANLPLSEANHVLMNAYRAFPIGVESPNHGNIDLLINPQDPNASPFGWHDTDGNPGAEFTITRGNNVYAQEDRNNDNMFGDSPDGGAGLSFDFIPDFNLDPIHSTNQNAALTNLFYWNNLLHDVLYQFGFTEESGNFQSNNYGKGGLGDDYVIADGLDGGGLNNANFGTPSDGSSPRMQMFLWNPLGRSFTVHTPANIAGNYSTGTANFGPPSYEVTGDLIVVTDGNDQGGTASTTDGCEPILNDLTGKIALIDRGLCAFSCKVENAQNQGAVAAIICNSTSGVSTMGAGSCADNVTIPSFMLSLEDCNTIRTLIPEVNATLYAGILVDGDFDNGIITHEYGHGVSNRLTGGPGTTGCLGGDEQMGEGWSDFLGLYFTTMDGSTGTDAKGIGTYAKGQSPTSGGLRQFPYSTDLNINPHTYNSIMTAAAPHGVGSVWCAMLWEVYWALVDEYGYSSDYYYGTGGNNMALHLVMEGMKMQPCNPGFVDGRNAILAADRALYNGANQCLIWEAFAKRGLGYSANQGSVLSKEDGVEAFDLPPTCKLSLTITVNRTQALPNDELEYTLTATNTTSNALSNIQLESDVPVNTLYVANSASDNGSLMGSKIIFPAFDLEVNEVQIRTFRVQIDANISLAPFDFLDDEADETLWKTYATYTSLNEWMISNDLPNSGEFGWFVEDVAEPNTLDLTLNIEQKIGSNTELSFFHSFDTEATWDGGTVEISTDNGLTWTDLGPFFSQNGYNSVINQSPNSLAFSGNSNGYIESIVNLAAFADEFALIRFVMHCDFASGGLGWYLDDIRLTQLLPSIPNQALADCNGQIVEANLDNPTSVVSVLPLELLTFSGKALKNSNLIIWTTADEMNISTFSVERSIDGKSGWMLIGQQEAKGQANAITNYVLEDQQPLLSAFYRLRTLETNGKESLSNLILLERKDHTIPSVHVFPNPVDDLLQLEFSMTNNAELEMVLYNVLGQEQLRTNQMAHQGLNQISWDVTALNGGVYWLTLESEGVLIYQGKVVMGW